MREAILFAGRNAALDIDQKILRAENPGCLEVLFLRNKSIHFVCSSFLHGCSRGGSAF